jgi:hypothetical protein
MNQNAMGLVKNHTASGAIAPYRIAAFDAGADTVKQATAGTDALCGVSGVRGTEAEGGRIDIYKDDVRTVEFGGVVAAGDPLTADADGKAVVAVPGADETLRVIGFAEESGGAGVRGQVHIAPQTIRG